MNVRITILTPDEALRNRFLMVIYGPTGIGKTTFVGTAPKPLVIDFEGGIGPLRGRTDVGVVQVRGAEEMDQVIDWLMREDASKLPYGVIAFDGLSNFAEHVFSDIAEQAARRRSTKGGYEGATWKEWGELTATLKRLIRRLHLIGKPVIITCTERVIKVEDKERYTVSLPPSSRRSLFAMADVVGVMLMDSDGQRFIAFQDRSGRYELKDRFGVLGKEPPNFGEIYEKVTSGGREVRTPMKGETRATLPIKPS
jgi:phage nucleotide-binding protein